MNEVISDATVKTRKSHICLGCLRSFPPGSIMHKQTNVFEGSIGSVYTCPACEELKTYIDPEDGWWMEGYTHDAIEGTDESPEAYLEKLRAALREPRPAEEPNPVPNEDGCPCGRFHKCKAAPGECEECQDFKEYELKPYRTGIATLRSQLARKDEALARIERMTTRGDIKEIARAAIREPDGRKGE